MNEWSGHSVQNDEETLTDGPSSRSTPLPLPPVNYPESTTYAPPAPPAYKGTCLLTYYGYTNETCWCSAFAESDFPINI